MQQSAGGGPSLIGSVVGGRFEILKKLGEGGMGAVFTAKDQSGTLYAVKQIHAELSDEATEARFQREALAMSRLQHPGIVRVIDFGRMPTNDLYLVMEFVDGQELSAVLESRGAFDLATSVSLLHQLISTVEFAHRSGVIHRDLKPENILVLNGEPARLKIIDFGLAKLVTGEEQAQLTQEGFIVGSPYYLAPEQARGTTITRATDMYAIGGIGYAILTGNPPFEADTLPALLRKQLFQAPRRLSESHPTLQLPQALDTLLFECLAKAPEERPTAARALELVNALKSDKHIGRALSRSQTSAVTIDAALAIWPEHVDNTFQFANHEIRDALCNQITAIVLDIGSGHAHAHVYVLNSLQEQTVDLEMDIALADSELADTPDNPALRGKRSAIAYQARAIQATIDLHYRELFNAIIDSRAHPAAEPYSGMYAELDALVERFINMSIS